MAFIEDSVGLGGKNNTSDVKIIQWMLVRAQSYYGTRLFSKDYKLFESGIADTDTNAAIRDIVIVYPNKSRLLDSNSMIYDMTSAVKPMILPDDTSYRFLIKCSIKPVCTVCVNDEYVKIDFNDDALALQAIAGRINLVTFKHAVEVRDGILQCETLTETGKTAKKYLGDARILAFLDMVAIVEGTDNDNDGIQKDFDVQMGGTPNNKIRVEDLSRHSGGVALGRYQAIPITWREAATILGLTDFTPESQNIFGAWKLATRGMIDDITNNRIAEAIDKGSLEWASFPNSAKTAANNGTPTSYHVYSRGPNKGKPQPTHRSVQELIKIYNTAEGFYEKQK